MSKLTIYLRPFILIQPGSAEVEVVKKSYTKLSDAYGCLGVLLVTSGTQIYLD